MRNELDCSLTPAPDKVVLRKIDTTTVSSGGFYLSADTLKNERAAFCKVEAIGAVAAKKTGVKVGDYVFADPLSSHYHTSPVMVIPWNGLILITDEHKGNLKTIPGYALLEKEEEPAGGFIAPDSNSIRKGKVIQIVYPEDLKPEEVPAFKVGDTVMLTSKCEVYDGFCSKPLIAMRFEEIVARFDHV